MKAIMNKIGKIGHRMRSPTITPQAGRTRIPNLWVNMRENLHKSKAHNLCSQQSIKRTRLHLQSGKHPNQSCNNEVDSVKTGIAGLVKKGVS